MSRVFFAFLALSTLFAAAPALAQDEPREADEADEELPYDQVHAFDREWALAAYGTGHAGSYLAGGIGGRIRWEPFDGIPLGMEAYLEATIVEWPGEGFRHDYPNGFNLYVPLRVDDVRVRPVLRLLRHPELRRARRRKARSTGGRHPLRRARRRRRGGTRSPAMASVFADLQFNGYAWDTTAAAEGWTGGVEEEFSFFWNIQLNLGAQFHAGR